MRENSIKGGKNKSVVYKCKECGGDIEIKDRGLGKCLYCGAVQTLPKEDDDLKNLLNRANSYRLSCDFDGAIYLYEEAIKIDENEPEIYWGLFLSKYGVEYVKDKETNYINPHFIEFRQLLYMMILIIKKPLNYQIHMQLQSTSKTLN